MVCEGGVSCFIAGFVVSQASVEVKNLNYSLSGAPSCSVALVWQRVRDDFLLRETHGMAEPHLAPSPCLSLSLLFAFISKERKRAAPLCDAVTWQSCKAVEMVLSHIKEYLDISKPFYSITENSELLLCYGCFTGRRPGAQAVLQRPQSYSRHVDTQSAGS